MNKAATRKKSANPLSNLVTALVAVFLLAAFLIFLLPVVVQSVFQHQLSKATGLPVRLGDVRFSLTRPQFLIKGIEFSNPKDFPPGILAQVGKVKARYSPSPQSIGWFELKRIEVDFKEFRLVRNERGHLNLPSVSAAAKGKGIAIGELVLNLNSVTYTELTGGQPLQQTFELGLANALYRNVKGVRGILEILNWEVLKRSGVEEKKAPALPELKPAVGVTTAGQSAPQPPASAPPAGSVSSQPEPSPAPPAPKAG